MFTTSRKEGDRSGLHQKGNLTIKIFIFIVKYKIFIYS